MASDSDSNSASNSNAPVDASTHRRRVSTQGMQLSYAYGAPSQPTTNQRLPVNPAASRQLNGPSTTRGESSTSAVAAPTGAERYARLKEAQLAGVSQPRPIPINYMPIPGSNPYTSVNVATAFHNASERKSLSPVPSQDSGPSSRPPSRAPSMEEVEPTENPKKRKIRKSTDGRYRKSATPTDEDASDGGRKRSSAKKRRSEVVNNQEEQDTTEMQSIDLTNGNPKTMRKPRRQTQDPGYKPSRDESSDDSQEEERNRPKSKNKARAQRIIAPRPSSPGRKVIGAFPSPEPDESTDVSQVTYTLNLPPRSPSVVYGNGQARSDTPLSASYDQESRMVRERELEDLLEAQKEAKQRSLDVARAVLANPSPHRSQNGRTTETNGVVYKVPPVVRARREIPAKPSVQPSRRQQDTVAPSDDGFGEFSNEDFSYQNENSPMGYKGGVALASNVRQFLELVHKYVRQACGIVWKPLRHAADILNESIGKISKLPWSTLLKSATTALILAILIGSLVEDRSTSRWIPQRSKQTSDYVRPELPPADFADLVKRLTAIEKATSDLSSAQQEARRNVVDLSKTQSRALDSLQANFADLSGDKERLNRDLASLSKRLATIQEADNSERQKLQSTIEKVQQRLASSETRQETDLALLKQLSSQIEKIQSNEKAAEKSLKQLQKQFDTAVTREEAVKIATDAIEKVLPAQMAVRLDRKGKVVVDPAFWSHLKSAFAPIGGATGSSTAPALSWNAFLETNEAALSRFVGDALDKQAADGAILSRKAFVELLKREMVKLTGDFEKQANDNVQSIGEEMLRKVDKQIASSRQTNSNTGAATFKLPDGSNVTEIVESLVDAAVLRYSKDTLGRPDYALFTGGARIIPALTSPSLEISPPGLWRKGMSMITGSGVVRGRPPVTALHPDLSVGSCWAFAGPTAQLGVRLSRRIIVADVTLEHASKDVAYDVSSAPTDFEVWGIVDDSTLAKQISEKRRLLSTQDAPLSSVPPSDRHFLLATGTYDVNASTHVQTFEVLSLAKSLQVPVSMVLLRILGTQGGSTGCLYRFRVGGQEV